MSNRSNLLPCLRLLCIAAAGFFATGHAAVAEPQEIKVVEHADTDAVTDTGDKGDTAGDILTFANEVYDADDKNKVGSDQGICFRTLVGKAWECFWTLSLDKGQITVEGPFPDAGELGAGDHRRHRRLCRRHGRHGAESARHRRQGLRFHLQNQVVAARAKPYRAKRHRLNTPVAYRLQLRPKARGAGESMGLARNLTRHRAS